MPLKMPRAFVGVVLLSNDFSWSVSDGAVCAVKRIVRAGAAKSASVAPSHGEKWAGSMDSSPRAPGGVRP